MSEVTSQVTITLGGGVDLQISKEGQLQVIDRVGHRINLGQATKDRFQDLEDYVRRLAVHALDAD